MWILCSGADWRDLLERFGPWKTVYHCFREWQRSGLFEQILALLHLKLNEESLIDWDLGKSIPLRQRLLSSSLAKLCSPNGHENQMV